MPRLPPSEPSLSLTRSTITSKDVGSNDTGSTNAGESARWFNSSAQISSVQASTRELAYGCVDWYLYGTETQQSLEH